MIQVHQHIKDILVVKDTVIQLVWWPIQHYISPDMVSDKLTIQCRKLKSSKLHQPIPCANLIHSIAGPLELRPPPGAGPGNPTGHTARVKWARRPANLARWASCLGLRRLPIPCFRQFQALSYRQTSTCREGNEKLINARIQTRDRH